MLRRARLILVSCLGRKVAAHGRGTSLGRHFHVVYGRCNMMSAMLHRT